MEDVPLTKMLTVTSIVNYLADIYVAGYGAGKAAHLCYGLDWLSGFVGQFQVWSTHPYIRLAKNRWARGDKKVKKTRHYLSRSEMSHLLSLRPPEGEQPDPWRMFLCLSWCFLLRRSEAVALLPGDVLSTTRAGERCYQVYIRNPKTAKGQSQTIYVPRETVPDGMLKYLDWFVSGANNPKDWDPWDRLVTQSLVIPWLRKSLPAVKAHSLCHHSMRHGRATDLFHECGFAIGGDCFQNRGLVTVGRWRSKAACHCYLHSKINWKQ